MDVFKSTAKQQKYSILQNCGKLLSTEDIFFNVKTNSFNNSLMLLRKLFLKPRHTSWSLNKDLKTRYTHKDQTSLDYSSTTNT